mgnify:FL=1
MPNKSGRKGYSGENEVVHYLRDLGVKVQRAFGSDGRALGESPDIDIKASIDELLMLIQVKRYKRFSIYKFFKNANVVALRGDHKKWLFVFSEDLMTELIQKLRGVRNDK